LSGRWEGDLARQEQLFLTARDAGMTVMTAFPLRHTPATNRLRELLATKLGSPLSVKLETVATVAGESLDIHQLTGLLDWRYIVGKSPRCVGWFHGGRLANQPEFPAAPVSPSPTARSLQQPKLGSGDSQQRYAACRLSARLIVCYK
jgi:hypothetical protein